MKKECLSEFRPEGQHEQWAAATMSDYQIGPLKMSVKGYFKVTGDYQITFIPINCKWRLLQFWY